jgi:hypothetical protein
VTPPLLAAASSVDRRGGPLDEPTPSDPPSRE